MGDKIKWIEVKLKITDELGVVLHRLTSTTINLLLDLSKLASNVSSVTVQHWTVSIANLARVVQNNHLGGEVRHSGGGLVLGVGGDVSSLDVLDRDVLDVEANVVSGTASGRDSWCISTDLTSVERLTGAKVTTMPGLITPVSTRPTGTVPMPPILLTS